MKKTAFYIIFLVLGIALAVTGFFIQAEELKAVSGIMIGVGASLAGVNISNLILRRYQKKHPELERASRIEMQDERNQQIRWRSRARSADISQWFVIGLAYVMILLNMPLWLIGLTVGIFVLRFILEMYYIMRYQKEM
jgi:hypothetical protein